MDPYRWQMSWITSRKRIPEYRTGLCEQGLSSSYDSSMGNDDGFAGYGNLSFSSERKDTQLKYAEMGHMVVWVINRICDAYTGQIICSIYLSPGRKGTWFEMFSDSNTVCKSSCNTKPVCMLAQYVVLKPSPHYVQKVLQNCFDGPTGNSFRYHRTICRKEGVETYTGEVPSQQDEPRICWLRAVWIWADLSPR